MRKPPFVLGVGVLVLGLVGCAAPAPHPSPTSPSGPPSFPRIDGTIVSTSEAVPGDWKVRVRVSDAPSGYRAARRLLVAGGYDLTNDQPFVDGGSGQACTTARCVTFSSVAGPAGGTTVDYEVFPNTGVAG